MYAIGSMDWGAETGACWSSVMDGCALGAVGRTLDFVEERRRETINFNEAYAQYTYI